MKLYLLRHTTPDIQRGICYGHADIPLSQSFNDEVGNIVKVLHAVKFDKIYSSPLKRCSLLAEIINIQGISIKYDERLTELNFGDWELQKWKDIAKTIEGQNWFSDYINVSCPGGESYNDLLNRVRDFISDLSDNIENQSILIVSHAGVIKSFYALINKTDVDEALKLKIGYGEILEMNLN